MRSLRINRGAAALPAALLAAALQAGEGRFSGQLAAEWLQFADAPAITPARPAPVRQARAYAALALQPEYRWESDDRAHGLVFVGHARWDAEDAQRRRADIRELQWTRVAGDWETRLGIGQEYWGVTEGVHLVDIVNQTDLAENPAGEDKLGQPMLKLSWYHDRGNLSLWVLPGFRPRTYPGVRGRPFPFVVDSDDAIYTSSAESRHVDFAARAYSYLGPFEIALSHFVGTSREPVLELQGFQGALPVLRPRYAQIRQTGLELTAVSGNWLWKFEGITRSGQGDRFSAATGGFEYTRYAAMGSPLDLGLIVEYLHDDRDGRVLGPVTQPRTTLENDLLLATRLTFNDFQGSEILAGVITDLAGGGSSYSIEASRRLGRDWLLSLEARGVLHSDAQADPLLHLLRDDDALRLTLTYHF